MYASILYIHLYYFYTLYVHVYMYIYTYISRLCSTSRYICIIYLNIHTHLVYLDRVCNRTNLTCPPCDVPLLHWLSRLWLYQKSAGYGGLQPACPDTRVSMDSLWNLCYLNRNCIQSFKFFSMKNWACGLRRNWVSSSHSGIFSDFDED